ncbi:uncharacterized protein G2W53_007741 [Senna tora]|uniref:Uncharacterized protein n=1 Tax=Senna tora TaxID=362788 RepID=A0A834X6Z5_9FABA|nr:uncharacterized protein G2W53_007741 [Senna tora]
MATVIYLKLKVKSESLQRISEVIFQIQSKSRPLYAMTQVLEKVLVYLKDPNGGNEENGIL